MTKQDHINYWIKTSENDLSSMESNFESGKYDWALFIGHLALEKILKALWVKNNGDNFPPKIHNLLLIAEKTEFTPSEEQKVFLNRANNFSLETRYPDYKFEFYKSCTKEYAKENIKNIYEIHKCIKEKI